ncbi:hypothetical protein U1Q18_008770, partial [Sarracenia purpurea var. burkii]
AFAESEGEEREERTLENFIDVRRLQNSQCPSWANIQLQVVLPIRNTEPSTKTTMPSFSFPLAKLTVTEEVLMTKSWPTDKPLAQAPPMIKFTVDADSDVDTSLHL